MSDKDSGKGGGRQVAQRGILFNGPMVRAILADQKTETRRLLGSPPPECPDHGTTCKDLHFERCEWPTGDVWTDGWTGYRRCPYGQPGDLLYVREMFSGPYGLRNVPPKQWGVHSTPIYYWADGRVPPYGDWTKPKPSIHMPRKLCRIWLRVEDVRVERLQEIDEAGILAEGITVDRVAEWTGTRWSDMPTLYDAFRIGWDFINGKRAPWNSDPWVWVVRFSRTEAPHA